MPTQQKKFTKRLIESEPARRKVAAEIRRARPDFDVYLPPLRIAPSADQWEEYLDPGDILVTPPDSRKRIVEVKRKVSMEFSSVETWKHYYPKEFLISYCPELKRSKEAGRWPYALVMVCQHLCHVGVYLLPPDESGWRKREYYDHRYGKKEGWYVRPEEAKFGPIEQVAELLFPVH